MAASTNPVDSFVYNSGDDEALRKALLDVALSLIHI